MVPPYAMIARGVIYRVVDYAPKGLDRKKWKSVNKSTADLLREEIKRRGFVPVSELEKKAK